MSRKLLFYKFLIPFSCFNTLFVSAQKEPISVVDYFFFYEKNRNFSVHGFLSEGNLAIFSQNQFLLKELCTATVSGSYNTKGNAAVLNISHFGYSKYGILTVSSGYARAFAKRVSFGLQLHYLLHHAEGYPQKSSFTFDLSLYGRISQKIGIGISAYNPANLKYGIIGTEQIPMLYVLTLDYKLNEKVLLAVVASKQLPGFFDIAGTICFKDRSYGFFMNCSLKKVEIQFSFWWKRVLFDVGGSFDYRLGFSPNAGIRYGFKHKDTKDTK
jgi:hypothetical protein